MEPLQGGAVGVASALPAQGSGEQEGPPADIRGDGLDTSPPSGSGTGAVAQLPGPNVAPAPPGSGFSLHEWGLVQYAEDGIEIASSGLGMRPPPTRPRPHPEQFETHARKPVLYLRPGPNFDPATEISVQVSLVGGTLREIWPTVDGGAQPSTMGGATHRWDRIRILPGEPCGPELAPALSGPACRSLRDGGVCESAELGSYLHPVDACLEAGGFRSPVLLYNGSLAAGAPPVGVTADGALSNSSDFSVGPIWVRGPGGLVRYASAAPGETIAPANGVTLHAIDNAMFLRDLRSALAARGLAEGELADFEAAWAPDVLDGRFAWQAFGLLSPEAIDAAYPLVVQPQPDEVRRVLAFVIR